MAHPTPAAAWLIPLEDLPLPPAMVESLATGGVTRLGDLAALLGGPAPIAPPVRAVLTACCHRFGVAPGERAVSWQKAHPNALEEASREQISTDVSSHPAEVSPRVAALAAWLAPGGESRPALIAELLGDWRPDAAEAAAALRAGRLLGEEPERWVRLADAHPVLLGQLLSAGLDGRTPAERLRLLAAIGDRLTVWIAAGLGESESQWTAAEAAALRAAARELELPEWWFTARARSESLADWIAGRPVPPETRERWRAAWRSPACRQWTAMRVLRQLLIG